MNIYTIAVQAAEGKYKKVFANYFPLALNSNVRSWLMHLPENSISSWADLCNEFVGAFTSAIKSQGAPVICKSFHRRKGRACENICRDSVECTATF